MRTRRLAARLSVIGTGSWGWAGQAASGDRRSACAAAALYRKMFPSSLADGSSTHTPVSPEPRHPRGILASRLPSISLSAAAADTDTVTQGGAAQHRHRGGGIRYQIQGACHGTAHACQGPGSLTRGGPGRAARPGPTRVWSQPVSPCVRGRQQ